MVSLPSRLYPLRNQMARCVKISFLNIIFDAIYNVFAYVVAGAKHHTVTQWFFSVSDETDTSSPLVTHKTKRAFSFMYLLSTSRKGDVRAQEHLIGFTEPRLKTTDPKAEN